MKKYIIIVVVLLCIFLLGTGIAYFFKLGVDNSKSLPKQTVNQTPLQTDAPSVDLTEYDKSNLTELPGVYQIQTVSVDEIILKNGDEEKTIPKEFNTLYFKGSIPNQTPIKRSDLKEGQKVRLYLFSDQRLGIFLVEGS